MNNRQCASIYPCPAMNILRGLGALVPTQIDAIVDAQLAGLLL